jgi:putative ABC transport system permease protein
MKRMASNIVGSLVEAWQEVRIHKTRVMLSLVGVAVAVCAITTVVALGGIAGQAMLEQNEKYGGRPANLQVSAMNADGSSPDASDMNEAWWSALDRYDIEFSSRNVSSLLQVQFADGASNVQTTGVDPAYGDMHRVRLVDGSWFTPADAERLAPAVIVNSIYYERLGSPDLATHPTTTLIGQQSTTAVVTGVFPVSQWDTEPAMYMLTDALQAIPTAVSASSVQNVDMYGFGSQPPTYEVWVPPELAVPLTEALQRDIKGALGSGSNVSVSRSDYMAYNDGSDPYLSMKLLVGGVAGLVLLLGALGLVNIALVSLKQRIREIGIRRSFGATASRVFFAVMMESVVATVVAGVIGVILAVLIVKNPMVEGFIGQGMVSDYPPFPVDAAIIGLVAATAVGALAGLLPALVAVRVKVIDAIRY